MRYFIVSDVHGFFSPLKSALEKAGFNPKNKNHTLVINGDLFDRGYEAVELYNYITSLPRVVLIRGNHEDLFCEVVKKNYFDSYDESNGTEGTFRQFAAEIDYNLYSDEEVIHAVRYSKYYRFINSDQWLNFLEIGPYVITHAFIPLDCISSKIGGPSHLPQAEAHDNHMLYSYLRYNPQWRKTKNFDSWWDARWGCPYELYDRFWKKEKENGKILIVGHWHTQDFYRHYEFDKWYKEDKKRMSVLNQTGEHDPEVFTKDFRVYQHENLIAEDACTARTHFCNVVIINDETMKTKFVSGPIVKPAFEF